MSGIKLVRSTVADRPLVVDFLRRHFYKHEPITVALGFADNPLQSDIDATLDGLHLGYSILAYVDGKLAGVGINTEKCDDALEIRRKMYEQCPDAAFKKAHKFWMTVEEKADFWRRFGVKSVLYHELTSVDEAMRGRGVGQALVDAYVDLGKKLGYEAIRADATNAFAARMMTNVGAKKVFSMMYEDFKGDDGKPIFIPPHPHNELAMYFKRY